MMLAGLSAYLASYAHALPAKQGKGYMYHNNPKLANKAAIKTTAAFAVVLGLVTSHRKGVPFIPAHADKTFHENLFIMMGSVNPGTKLPNPKHLDVFRRMTILNADNGSESPFHSLYFPESKVHGMGSCEHLVLRLAEAGMGREITQYLQTSLPSLANVHAPPYDNHDGRA